MNVKIEFMFKKYEFVLLLSEVLSLNGRPIKANPQTRRYLNPASQLDIRRMLSYRAPVHRSTVGRCKQHEDDFKKHQ